MSPSLFWALVAAVRNWRVGVVLAARIADIVELRRVESIIQI